MNSNLTQQLCQVETCQHFNNKRTSPHANLPPCSIHKLHNPQTSCALCNQTGLPSFLPIVDVLIMLQTTCANITYVYMP